MRSGHAPSWSFLKTWRAVRPPLPGWRFLDGWSPPRPEMPRWKSLGEWFGLARMSLLPEARGLVASLASWDQRLAAFGGDPSRRDWVAPSLTFRPLATEREERWSDWLAWLIATSESGQLLAELVGAEGDTALHFARPLVHREATSTTNSRRADIVVVTANQAVCVEVKLWDSNFGKTAETALAMREYARGAAWRDLLLLPPSQLSLWREEIERANPNVGIVTWTQVSTALRRLLWQGKEDLAWRGLAYVFTGVIEQVLLDMPRFFRSFDPEAASLTLLAQAARLATELKEASNG